MAQDDEQEGDATVYKVKLVQFLGRSVPIVLQSDNGPCPLLSILSRDSLISKGNALLLRNNVTVNQDISEISERDLLSLVAERLLDANYNLEGKDEEYVRNQQQNIADAISLLPRLATGIDVNVRFRNTQDFEFTTECAIFDLLDIGLYHGWICEDEATKSVIGADSYNTLADRLAALQASRPDSRTLERESSVDFNAAITATFTVPSPSLSSVAASLCSEYNEQSPDDSTDLSTSGGRRRKGDEQEVAQLLEALELSKSGARSPRFSSSGSLAAGDSGDYSGEVLSEGSPVREETVSAYAIPVRSPGPPPAEGHITTTVPHPESGTQLAVMNVSAHIEVGAAPSGLSQPTLAEKSHINQDVGDTQNAGVALFEGWAQKPLVSPSNDDRAAVTAESSSGLVYEEFSQESAQDIVDSKDWIVLSRACSNANTAVHTSGDIDGAGGSLYLERAEKFGAEDASDLTDDVRKDGATLCEEDGVFLEVTKSSLHSEDSTGNASSIGKQVMDAEEDERAGGGHSAVTCDFGYHVGEGEALYEGEVVQRGPGSVQVDTKEPLYEGEAALGEEAQIKISSDDSTPGTVTGCSKEVENLEVGDSIGAKNEERLIENFLINSNQLTWTGLFSLQEEVKERELCVFFRNNHFSTMFKYNKDLYLLATDQGYLHQPDLVWEKLDQVDGNHSFVTGNFTPFQAESNTGSWNEQSGLALSEDYIPTQGEPHGAGADYSSDLQLALALQQQEFEEQQQPVPQQAEQVQARVSEPPKAPPPARPSVGSAVGRLITGPRTSTATPKPEAKKEKCVIM